MRSQLNEEQKKAQESTRRGLGEASLQALQEQSHLLFFVFSFFFSSRSLYFTRPRSMNNNDEGFVAADFGECQTGDAEG